MKPLFSTNVWLLFVPQMGDEYYSVMGWLRCSFSFSLLRSAIQCIRGARSSIGHYVSAPTPMDLVRVESNLTIGSNDTRK